MKRILASLLMLAAALSVRAGAALAQGVYPSSPIRMIVPFPAGSGTDVSARFLAQRLTGVTGQPVIVENKAGGNGLIAAQAAAQAPADGYTVFFTTVTTQVVNPHIYAKLPYDPVKDFTPVGLIYRSPSLLVVRRAEGQPRTLAELTEKARTNPGKVSFASGNMSSRVAAEVYGHQIGARLLHVPYKGVPQAITDLLGGQVDMMFADLTNAMPHIRKGDLTALAVTGSRRPSALPEVRTMDEQGIRGMDLTPWAVLYLPSRTPRPVVDCLSRLLLEVLHTAAVQAFYARYGGELMPLSPAQTAAFLNAEFDTWGKAIRIAGIEAE